MPPEAFTIAIIEEAILNAAIPPKNGRWPIPPDQRNSKNALLAP
jgi:hypothetical protein